MSRTLAATVTSRSLAITNPLVLYRSLLQTKQIAPDPAQFRLAIHLQKLYKSLLDYSPEDEYGARLEAIGRVVGDTASEEGNKRGNRLAAPGHPIRRNPLFAHIFAEKQKRDTLALTRILTNYEEAMALDSPKGLLLHGEVGNGKSMMVDLLADCLPNKKKRRWHFNTFMLEILARLEQRRIDGSDDSEHSLTWLAKDLVDTSPILFLDEFQLPDRTAAKILSNLLTAFFQLGGVLIASSNRMPDELSKASGFDFTAPAGGGFMRKWLGYGDARTPSMFPSNNEYAPFVEVLKARCEIWDMRGDKDWRRRDEEIDDTEGSETQRQKMIEDVICQEAGKRSTSASSSSSPDAPIEAKSLKLPKKYLTLLDKVGWQEAIQATLPTTIPSPIPWQSDTIMVYGRKVPVPKHCQGVTLWTFHELCESTLGPADFISLASTFHTFILDQVPTLHLSQKNEARRFITLLDALYEARCKLVVRAGNDPDHLFFPEMRANSSGLLSDAEHENDDGDAVYPETLSEIYQDQTSPFRPNISSYTDEPKAGYGPDEDSDFGPIPGKGNEIGRQVDFGNTGSFMVDSGRCVERGGTQDLT
ncbi:AFG1-like ATPase-domain-containing protein [Amylocarpus encephaloides]|uniref:AFG1-like ATPase-domain-containing protein n=1 Tax=Amylocarpus encephaloides TaxID=45428 RepID=A0A9P7YIP3_9HELO|nr:AFG1-like ATPase-domain-containing protein [Amylocarpus encephaloides]